MDFYLFALLPLGLASLFSRRLPRSTAGFGFLAALAPVIAKGLGSLISYKQGKSAAKQAEEQRKLEGQQADARARQEWEAQQNSPAAQAPLTHPDRHGRPIAHAGTQRNAHHTRRLSNRGGGLAHNERQRHRL